LGSNTEGFESIGFDVPLHAHPQARRQDIAAGGPKTRRRG